MKQSAGILLYRTINGVLEVMLAHPGGPFWAKKDAGVWTIPKGEFDDTEDPLQAAIREFEEETGTKLDGKFTALQPRKLKSGKTVYCWAIEGDLNTDTIRSNTFDIEWPPKSGRMQTFPEIDKAAWFTTNQARKKINPGQVGFINELEESF